MQPVSLLEGLRGTHQPQLCGCLLPLEPLRAFPGIFLWPSGYLLSSPLPSSLPLNFCFSESLSFFCFCVSHFHNISGSLFLYLSLVFLSLLLPLSLCISFQFVCVPKFLGLCMPVSIFLCYFLSSFPSLCLYLFLFLLSLAVFLFISASLSLALSLSVHISVFPCVSYHFSLSLYLSVNLFACLFFSVSLSQFLCLCLSPGPCCSAQPETGSQEDCRAREPSTVHYFLFLIQQLPQPHLHPFLPSPPSLAVNEGFSQIG